MIILCRECGRPMINILHYEKDKSYAYSFCKTCFYTTKPKKIIYESIKEYKETKKPYIKKSKGRKFKWS